MANYINSEILAEAYTHLEIDLFEDKVKLEALKRDLTNFFSERASFLFGTDVQIKVEFEEGSLKTKVIAIGSAAATIIGLISAYGGFRESVVQLASDATSLAQSANMEVIYRTRTAHCDRLRIEKRRGVFGRVHGLLVDLDAVSAKVSESKLPTNQVSLRSANAVTDSLLRWDGEVLKLFSKFEDPETTICISGGLLEEVKKLPKQFPWHESISGSSFRSEIIESDSRLSGQIAAANARYAATVRSLQKKLDDSSKSVVAKSGGG